MTQLLSYSVFIIGILALLTTGYFEYRRYLSRKTLDSPGFQVSKKSFREKLDEIVLSLSKKFLVSLVVAFIISLISFREIWINDVFHIVFLTNLLSKPTWKYLDRLIK